MKEYFKISVCLDGLKEFALKNAKSGKTYLYLTAVPRKEVGQFGETHFLKAARPVGDGKWDDVICGNLQPIVSKNNDQQKGDLPF